jgi:hypothetical protein
MRLPSSPYPMQRATVIPFPAIEPDAETPESIQAAREAMFEERTRCGIYTFEVICPRCGVTIEGSGFSEGEAEGHAVRDITRHLVRDHAAGAA